MRSWRRASGALDQARRRRAAIAPVVACLLAAACGSGSASPPEQPGPAFDGHASSSDVAQAEEGPLIWEASRSNGASVAGGADDAASAGEPSSSGGVASLAPVDGVGTLAPVEPAGPPAPLTGVPVADESTLRRRAVAVKVDNNNSQSRPHYGLAAADVVFEVLVEGAATRFLAVFQSDIPDRVGPVRSARLGDVDLIADLGSPYFVYSGANSAVLSAMRRARSEGVIDDVGALRTSVPYWRDPQRRSPHNLFFEYARLEEPTEAQASPLFEYGPAADNGPGLPDAVGVTVTYHAQSGNVVSHVWDEAHQGWVRVQRGELHTSYMVDAQDEVVYAVEMAPANVVVLYSQYERSGADSISPQLVSFGAGEALVLTGGAVHNATWERSEDRRGYRFRRAGGEPLKLSPGATWLLMANESRRFSRAQAEPITASEGAAMLESVRAPQTAGNGEAAS